MDLHTVIETLLRIPVWVAFAALFLAAGIEYVFPPLPGDVVVVAASALVAVYGWPLVPVLLVVTAGSVLGSTAAFFVGRWLAARGHVERLGPRQRRALDWVLVRFERFGAPFLVANRFLPAVRGVFFLAAGLSGFRLGPVVLWSTLSSLAWNTLLLLLGYAIGRNLDLLERVVSTYSVAVGVFVVIVFGAVGWKLWRVAHDDGGQA